MNGTQYEEFCRMFLTDKFRIPIETIQSCRIPSSTHPGLSEYKNQIDLYWEDGNELVRYVNIADAKWRGGSEKVEISNIRELQLVKMEIDAHKAMIITNNGFDSGVKALAENRGIALHIVRPNFDDTILHPKDRETIQAQLQEPFIGSKPAYIHEVVYRAFDLGTGATEQTSVPGKTVTHSKEIRQTPMNRMAQPTSHRGAPPGIQKVQGGQGSSRTGGRGGAVQKGTGPARGSGGRSNRGK